MLAPPRYALSPMSADAVISLYVIHFPFHGESPTNNTRDRLASRQAPGLRRPGSWGWIGRGSGVGCPITAPIRHCVGAWHRPCLPVVQMDRAACKQPKFTMSVSARLAFGVSRAVYPPSAFAVRDLS